MNTNFYQQHSGIDIEFFYASDPNSLFAFGVSGADDKLSFSGYKGFLYNNSGKILGPCDLKENSLKVFSKNLNGSLYLNDRLIDVIDMSGTAYSSVFSNSDGNYSFGFNLYADKPAITTGSLLLQDNGTGLGSFYVSGEHSIRINSITFDEKYGFGIVGNNYEATEVGTGINYFVFSGSGNYPTGSALVTLDTDAGDYELVYDFSKPFVETGGYIRFYVDDDIESKDQTINFFIENTSPSSQEVGISLKEVAAVETGLYEITCSGIASFSASFDYSGPKLVTGAVTLDITGSGGKNNEVVTTGITTVLKQRYVPVGSENRDLEIYATGIVDVSGMGTGLYYGYIEKTYSARSNDGFYTYEISNAKGVPTTATLKGGSFEIAPSVTDIFTGDFSRSFPITGSYSDDITGLVSSGVYIDEGPSNFYELWEITLNGSGFVDEGWTGEESGVNTIGLSSPVISIPANSTISGQITFSNSFSGIYYHAAEFFVNSSSLVLSMYV